MDRVEALQHSLHNSRATDGSLIQVRTELDDLILEIEGIKAKVIILMYQYKK